MVCVCVVGGSGANKLGKLQLSPTTIRSPRVFLFFLSVGKLCFSDDLFSFVTFLNYFSHLIYFLFQLVASLPRE